MTKVVFDPNFKTNSVTVEDERVWKVVRKKFEFIESVGMRYPSLKAKKLQNSDNIWEFYITRKWRCFFRYNEKKDEILVIKIGNHL